MCLPLPAPIQLGCKFRGAWNHVYFAYRRKHKLTSCAMYNGYYVNQLVQVASSPMAYRRSMGRGVAWFCAAAYKLPTSNNDNGNKDSKISFSNSRIVWHWYKCFNDLILKKKIRKYKACVLLLCKEKTFNMFLFIWNYRFYWISSPKEERGKDIATFLSLRSVESLVRDREQGQQANDAS